jgi:hypothetical protein
VCAPRLGDLQLSWRFVGLDVATRFWLALPSATSTLFGSCPWPAPGVIPSRPPVSPGAEPPPDPARQAEGRAPVSRSLPVPRRSGRTQRRRRQSLKSARSLHAGAPSVAAQAGACRPLHGGACEILYLPTEGGAHRVSPRFLSLRQTRKSPIPVPPIQIGKSGMTLCVSTARSWAVDVALSP